MLYYLVDNDEDIRYEDGDEESCIEYCIDPDYFMDDEDSFDEYLNDTEERIQVYGYNFNPADVLHTDSDAYYEALRSWADGELDNACDNARYEFNHCRDGDVIYICNHEVHVYEADEEEPEEDECGNISYDNLQRCVETQKEAERTTKEENAKREDDFMAVFQTL